MLFGHQKKYVYGQKITNYELVRYLEEDLEKFINVHLELFDGTSKSHYFIFRNK